MEFFSLASALRQNPDKQMPLKAREKIQEEERLSSPSHSSLGIFLSLFLPSARGSQWGGGFYGYRLKFWFFYGYRLSFFSYG